VGFDPVTLGIISVGLSAASAGSTVMSGIAANKQAKFQAKQLEQQAKDNELKRLERTTAALARNEVAAAAGGISLGSGSFQVIQDQTRKQYEIDKGTDSYNTRIAKASVLSRGRNAKRLAFLDAATTLGKAAVSAKQTGKTPGVTSGSR